MSKLCETEVFYIRSKVSEMLTIWKSLLKREEDERSGLLGRFVLFEIFRQRQNLIIRQHKSQ